MFFQLNRQGGLSSACTPDDVNFTRLHSSLHFSQQSSFPTL
jgi:hypothetical protein